MYTTHCLTRKIFKTAIYSGLLLFAFACTKQQTNNPSNGNGGGVKDILPVAGFQYEISSTTPTVTFKGIAKLIDIIYICHKNNYVNNKTMS